MEFTKEELGLILYDSTIGARDYRGEDIGDEYLSIVGKVEGMLDTLSKPQADDPPKCSPVCIETRHIDEPNSYPHGEHVSYDECIECGEIYNFKIH